MRRYFLFLAVIAGLLAGCGKFSQQKAIAIVNSGAVNADVIEQIRSFVEKELKVIVRSTEDMQLASAGNVDAAMTLAQKIRGEGDVIFIAVTAIPESEDHLTVDTETRTAIVNVEPLKTDDAQKFERRIERQVMRAAAFAVGLAPTPDPYCVTRDYSSLEDLDRMGRNFSPPWQGRFAGEVEKLGLTAPEADACKGGVCPFKK
ncbi:MAG: hypothetical protein WC959_09630 [Kiritimatiellales bacterium]